MKRLEELPFYTLFLKKARRRKFCLTFLCVFSLLSLGIYSIQLCILTINYYNPPPSRFTNNYFLSAEEVVNMGYLVRTPTCSILNVSAWDEAILPILIQEDIPPSNCRALEQRQWTYTLNSSLVINETAMIETGYSLSSVSCCYFAITRITQSIDNYNENADARVRYSKPCLPLTQVTTPLTSPYVRVHCKAKYWPFSSDVLYRRFHAVSLLPTTVNVTKKTEHWKSSQVKPPNVVIVGIDSMSRLSFHRTMPKTRRILEKVGAIEMLGYTKVGENTLPNMVACLSGYSEPELRESCFHGDSTAHDTCADFYLWRRFSEAKYLTALIEDAPLLAIFHYLKTGFVNQPTDFYFRPFMLAVHQHQPSPFFTFDCMGPDRVDEVILRYISDVISSCKAADLPLFLFSWMTNLAHGNLMMPKYADDMYADFLSNLDLTNTILFFMGDHGYRFGEIRQTFPGWYEDKLPNLWIYLPPAIQKSHPHWLKSLQTNSQKLTSTFDLHWTMAQILDEFSQVPPLPLLRNKNTGKEMPKQFGQSLFTKVPLRRKCAQAGIRDSICACIVPQRLPLNDTRLKEAASAATAHINSLLPPQCTFLQVLNVVAGAVLRNSETEQDAEFGTFVVAFITYPGEFQFEATVSFIKNNKTEPSDPRGVYKLTSDVLRMNKISTDVSCVHDGFMEKLCYCASSQHPPILPKYVPFPK